jgi:serine/threonine protein kinase
MLFSIGEYIDNKFKIVRKIGSGSFGTVYIGKPLFFMLFYWFNIFNFLFYFYFIIY